eukprot:422444-Pleurochrysis_carterae.AAC.1
MNIDHVASTQTASCKTGKSASRYGSDHASTCLQHERRVSFSCKTAHEIPLREAKQASGGDNARLSIHAVAMSEKLLNARQRSALLMAESQTSLLSFGRSLSAEPETVPRLNDGGDDQLMLGLALFLRKCNLVWRET